MNCNTTKQDPNVQELFSWQQTSLEITLSFLYLLTAPLVSPFSLPIIFASLSSKYSLAILLWMNL